MSNIQQIYIHGQIVKKIRRSKKTKYMAFAPDFYHRKKGRLGVCF